MKETEYLKRWKRENAERSTCNVTVAGLDLLVDKNVFSPDPELTHSTLHLINNLPNLQGKDVLDVGTGSGVIAIIAAKRGAEKVAAVDMDSTAVENAQKNISQYGLESTISVVNSDLFENVDDKFDVIIASLPIWGPAWRSQVKSIAALYNRFFSEVRAHMKPGGKIIFSYASFGDMEIIEDGMRLSGLKYKTIMEKRFDVEWYVFESV